MLCIEVYSETILVITRIFTKNMPGSINNVTSGKLCFLKLWETVIKSFGTLIEVIFCQFVLQFIQPNVVIALDRGNF